MARKGGTKVRTGCLTCKYAEVPGKHNRAPLLTETDRARKVKCDEAKPSCIQCIKIGRSCKGYGKPQVGVLGYSPHGQPSQYLFYRINRPDEGRALQFYSEVAAPSLPGATDPYFWTHIVLQFGNFEPAVRHSIIAISALYEARQVHRVPEVQLRSNQFALQHYNNAIHEIKKTSNQSLVLLVCVLFICIEYLQSNQHIAIKHCRHGIKIIQQSAITYNWTQQYLVPIFQRLSFLPIFFGKKGSSDFPDLAISGVSCPDTFPTFESAYRTTQAIMSRAMRLMRNGTDYRLRTSYSQLVPKELLDEQKVVRDLLDQWQTAFSRLITKLNPHDPISTLITEDFGIPFSRRAFETSLYLSHQVSCIWAETAFITHEMDFDGYLDVFKRILRQAGSLIRDFMSNECDHPNPKMPKFKGFLALLNFIAVKCRCLRTRTMALEMQTMTISHEGVWNLESTVAIIRRLIEIEHGVQLDNTGKMVTAPRHGGLPPESARVRGIWGVSSPFEQLDASGTLMLGRTVSFCLMGTNGTTSLQTEFLPDDLDAARRCGFTSSFQKQKHTDLN